MSCGMAALAVGLHTSVASAGPHRLRSVLAVDRWIATRALNFGLYLFFSSSSSTLSSVNDPAEILTNYWLV